jgi:hypothetical protein
MCCCCDAQVGACHARACCAANFVGLVMLLGSLRRGACRARVVRDAVLFFKRVVLRFKSAGFLFKSVEEH